MPWDSLRIKECSMKSFMTASLITKTFKTSAVVLDSDYPAGTDHSDYPAVR